MKGQEQLFSSKSDEWATPQDFFNQIDRKFGFLCDVCATEENAKCDIYFDKDQDGLKEDWLQRNWCNPPYSNIVDWVFKAHTEALNGNLTVMLIPSRTDTRWFHDVIYKKYQIEFIRGRLKFGDSKNSAPFPSMLVYFGIAA